MCRNFQASLEPGLQTFFVYFNVRALALRSFKSGMSFRRSGVDVGVTALMHRKMLKAERGC